MRRGQRVFVVVMAFLLTLFAEGTEGAEDGPVFKVGVLFCLTGPCADQGTNALKGAKLAVDEINAAGGLFGRPLRLLVEDTAEATSGAGALSAYQRLRIDSGVRYFLGPTWTPASLSLAPVVSKQADVLMVTTSVGVPGFHKSGDNLFNIRGTDETATKRTAKFAFESGWRRAAVFSSQQPWESSQADAFVSEFKRLGGTVVSRVDPLPTLGNVETEVLKVSGSRPETVFLSSIIFMPMVARRLAQLRYSGALLGSYIDDTLIAEAQGALNGAVFFTFGLPTPQFRDKFSSGAAGDRVAPDTAWGYDAVQAIAAAIRRAGTFEPSIVKRAMLEVSFDGASGPIRFDPDGCAMREPVQYRVAGSRIVAASAGER